MKRVILVIQLVEESSEIVNAEIKKEIKKALTEETVFIPWFKKLGKITLAE